MGVVGKAKKKKINKYQEKYKEKRKKIGGNSFFHLTVRYIQMYNILVYCTYIQTFPSSYEKKPI